MISKVTSVGIDELIFDNGKLYSEHYQDCCESHYLYFGDLNLDDFEGLEFDLTNDNFLIKVPDFGIKLQPLNGFPIPVPGYASNNGYYSSNLSLMIEVGEDKREIDITECQDYN